MNIRENRGITLIMLIVTIIVLLILSGITISAITGGESTIDKASQAKNENEIKAEMEELQEIINQSAAKGIRHGNYSGSADAITIRDALKNNSLIVENPDEVIIDGQSEWIVTGKKTNTQYAIQANGDVIRLIDTGSIKVGDTVNYTPSGTYNWDAEYATSYEVGTTDYNNANQTLDSSTDDFKISTWKVLNIDRKTGNIELVPSNQTKKMVTLQGAQGYNNGVKLLDDACNSLYGTPAKGIIARSIKEEDFAKAGKIVNNLDNKANNNWTRYRAAYNNNIVTYNNQLSSPYSKNSSWYPNIYGEESSNGLERSKQNGFIPRTILQGDNSVENSKLKADDGIRPIQTYYSTVDYNTSKELLDDLKGGLLFPNKSSANCWVASRCVLLYSSRCAYCVYTVWKGGVGAHTMFNSDNANSKDSHALFPIVTLTKDNLQKISFGTYNVK